MDERTLLAAYGLEPFPPTRDHPPRLSIDELKRRVLVGLERELDGARWSAADRAELGWMDPLEARALDGDR